MSRARQAQTALLEHGGIMQKKLLFRGWLLDNYSFTFLFRKKKEKLLASNPGYMMGTRALIVLRFEWPPSEEHKSVCT
jgi:hypothetical protein